MPRRGRRPKPGQLALIKQHGEDYDHYNDDPTKQRRGESTQCATGPRTRNDEEAATEEKSRGGPQN